MMSMNLSNIAVSNIHDVDYSCIINGITVAINLLENVDLTKKIRTL